MSLSDEIKEMIDGKREKYSFIIAVAKRAREIINKAELSGESLEEKAINIAIKDLKSGKYIISKTK